MSDDALIDAILAAPDDDAPRLVYADVLTERGDPQGELIVIQCTRARLAREGKRGSPEDVRLHLAEAALRVRPNADVDVERGFVTRMRTNPAELRTAWPRLVREPLEHMSFYGGDLDLLRLVTQHPTLRTIEVGSIANTNRNRMTLDVAVLRSLHLAGQASIWSSDPLPIAPLTEAALGMTVIGPDQETMKRLPALPRLAELRIVDTQLLMVDAAAELQQLEHVTSLMLRPTERTLTTALLAAVPPKLRVLEVTANDTLPPVAALPQLTSFSTNLRLEDERVRDLDRAPNLDTLLLDQCPVSGVASLLATSVVHRLERLRLYGGFARTGDDLPPAFSTLPKLRELSLLAFSIDEAIARRLVRELDYVRELSAFGHWSDAQAQRILAERWPLGRFD